jgi:hypothetical protein
MKFIITSNTPWDPLYSSQAFPSLDIAVRQYHTFQDISLRDGHQSEKLVAASKG